jgi:hypothetical protein
MGRCGVPAFGSSGVAPALQPDRNVRTAALVELGRVLSSRKSFDLYYTHSHPVL